MYGWIILFKTDEIYAASILISVIFIVLSAGFVFFIINFKIRQGAHLKEKQAMEAEFSKQLMQSQIEVQEATMFALGQELHDNICQQMSSTKLLASYAIRRPAEAGRVLSEIEGHLGNTIGDIRSLTKSLDKEWLEQFDLVANLEAEIERINTAQTVGVSLSRPNDLPLGPDKQIMLFRIIQEALQNAVKHSGAKEIQVDIKFEDGFVQTEVNDNGHGFQVNNEGKGLGIRNMKHRTRLLNGTIEWLSGSDGARVKISIPVKEEMNEN
jgi:signal transduction histidine kinase